MYAGWIEIISNVNRIQYFSRSLEIKTLLLKKTLLLNINRMKYMLLKIYNNQGWGAGAGCFWLLGAGAA